jgi:hypothetical protein
MAREAIAFSLRFLGDRQYLKLADLLNEEFAGWKGFHDPQYLMNLTLDPWDIHSKTVFTRIGSLLGDDEVGGVLRIGTKGCKQTIAFLPLRLQSDSFVNFLVSKCGIYVVSRSSRTNMLFAPLQLTLMVSSNSVKRIQG